MIMRSKDLAALLVLAAHLVAVSAVIGSGRLAPQHASPQPDSAAIVTNVMMERRPDLDLIPMPAVYLDTIVVNTDALTQVRFDDPEQGDISGVTGLASAPRLTQSAHALLEARWAKGMQGHILTVLLTIEVSAAGVVDSAVVARGCGNPSVDAQALQFVRTLAWVPGTVDHHAQPVRIQFPVTLIWPT
jgi:TonB family protein